MLLLFILFGSYTRTAKFWAGYAGAVVFAIVPVYPCPVDLVCQYTLWIMAGTRFKTFHCLYQALSLYASNDIFSMCL